jgi:hypothetical protein
MGIVPTSVAGDPSGRLPAAGTRALHATVLIVSAFAISAALATYSLVAASGDGAHVAGDAAGDLVTHFAIMVFAASLVTRPLARLFPTRFLRMAALESENLRLAFLVVFAFSLACVIAPTVLSGQSQPASAALYLGFNTLILIVMIFTTWRETIGPLGRREWRAIRVIGTTYFWFAFVLSDLAQLSESTSVGSWPQFSLTLLLSSAGLLIAARALSGPEGVAKR